MQAEAPGTAPVDIVQCWRTIGVHGDRSCPQLAQHLHCRNCGVFADAAALLLERTPPADHLAEWSRLLAQPAPEQASFSRSAVVFRVAAEWLALPTAAFEEILAPRPVHSLPRHRRGPVLGLANIRGELLPCLSLRQLLAIEEPAGGTPASGPQRLMVLAHQGQRVACPVDTVESILRYDPAALGKPPQSLSRSSITHTQGILDPGGRAIGLLDDELLFQSINRSLTSATAT